MNKNFIIDMLKVAYARVLRPLLLKAIDDPDEQWDDYVLAILDKIFEYRP